MSPDTPVSPPSLPGSPLFRRRLPVPADEGSTPGTRAPASSREQRSRSRSRTTSSGSKGSGGSRTSRSSGGMKRQAKSVGEALSSAASSGRSKHASGVGPGRAVGPAAASMQVSSRRGKSWRGGGRGARGSNRGQGTVGASSPLVSSIRRSISVPSELVAAGAVIEMAAREQRRASARVRAGKDSAVRDTDALPQESVGLSVDTSPRPGIAQAQAQAPWSTVAGVDPGSTGSGAGAGSRAGPSPAHSTEVNGALSDGESPREQSPGFEGSSQLGRSGLGSLAIDVPGSGKPGASRGGARVVGGQGGASAAAARRARLGQRMARSLPRWEAQRLHEWGRARAEVSRRAAEARRRERQAGAGAGAGGSGGTGGPVMDREGVWSGGTPTKAEAGKGAGDWAGVPGAGPSSGALSPGSTSGSGSYSGSLSGSGGDFSGSEGEGLDAMGFVKGSGLGLSMLRGTGALRRLGIEEDESREGLGLATSAPTRGLFGWSEGRRLDNTMWGIGGEAGWVLPLEDEEETSPEGEP